MELNQNKNLMPVVSVYKPTGLTPLQALDLLREKYPEYSEAKLTYAGRLDPLAEGVMLVVVGDEVINKDKYLGLNKEYVAEVLFGVATDTGDVLGIPRTDLVESGFHLEIQNLVSILPSFVRKFVQEYPRYSSPKIDGKENFSKEVEIKNLELVSVSKISVSDLQRDILAKIAGVSGDFRQTDILPAWDTFFTKTKQSEFVLAKIKVVTSSGVYVRVLAENIGAKLGVPALAYHILRTRVGEYTIDTALKLD